MKLHPATTLFPELTGPEFDALVEDIRNNGQQEPIRLYEGEVIDGRNRLRACKKLKITPNFKPVKKNIAPLAFVMSANYYRRHLTAHQKGAALLAVLKQQNGSSRKTGRPRKDGTKKSVTVTDISRQLGIPEPTARRQIKAAKTYAALPKPVQEKVDSGECPLEIAPKVVETMDRRTAKRIETARKNGELDELRRMEEEHIKLKRRINATHKWLQNIENGCRSHQEFVFTHKWTKAEKSILRPVGAAMVEFGKKLQEI